MGKDESETYVDTSLYYGKAILWAAEQGRGNNTFSPDADCTRAEIVTLLYRYCEPELANKR